MEWYGYRQIEQGTIHAAISTGVHSLRSARLLCESPKYLGKIARLCVLPNRLSVAGSSCLHIVLVHQLKLAWLFDSSAVEPRN